MWMAPKRWRRINKRNELRTVLITVRVSPSSFTIKKKKYEGFKEAYREKTNSTIVLAMGQVAANRKDFTTV